MLNDFALIIDNVHAIDWKLKLPEIIMSFYMLTFFKHV
jgi:hypothetical protein